jgi:hypothetical protein
MRAMSATEVPPNFCTIKRGEGMAVIVSQRAKLVSA